MAICDAYHAMTVETGPTASALAPEAALAELQRCAGGQFDPELVDTFCELLAPAPGPDAAFWRTPLTSTPTS